MEVEHDEFFIQVYGHRLCIDGYILYYSSSWHYKNIINILEFKK